MILFSREYGDLHNQALLVVECLGYVERAFTHQHTDGDKHRQDEGVMSTQLRKVLKDPRPALPLPYPLFS